MPQTETVAQKTRPEHGAGQTIAGRSWCRYGRSEQMLRSGAITVRCVWTQYIMGILTATYLLLAPQPGLAEEQPASSLQGASEQLAAPIPSPIPVQVFEAWRVSCGGAEADSCRVWQRVQVVAGDVAQDVMSVSLAPSEGTDGLVLVIQTPSDVYLPADFALRIDRGRERRARFRNCNAAGCWVVMPVDADFLRDLRRGLEAQAAFSLVEGETVRISFSLLGMTAALAAYEAERAARG